MPATGAKTEWVNFEWRTSKRGVFIFPLQVEKEFVKEMGEVILNEKTARGEMVTS